MRRTLREERDLRTIGSEQQPNLEEGGMAHVYYRFPAIGKHQRDPLHGAIPNGGAHPRPEAGARVPSAEGSKEDMPDLYLVAGIYVCKAVAVCGSVVVDHGDGSIGFRRRARSGNIRKQNRCQVRSEERSMVAADDPSK